MAIPTLPPTNQLSLGIEPQNTPRAGTRKSLAVATPARKSWVTAVQLSFALGVLGADRFYLGYWRLGALKLATLGGFGLWFLADLVLIMRGQIPDAQGRPLTD
jgi:hypothetical protein